MSKRKGFIFREPERNKKQEGINEINKRELGWRRKPRDGGAEGDGGTTVGVWHSQRNGLPHVQALPRPPEITQEEGHLAQVYSTTGAKCAIETEMIPCTVFLGQRKKKSEEEKKKLPLLLLLGKHRVCGLPATTQS